MFQTLDGMIFYTYFLELLLLRMGAKCKVMHQDLLNGRFCFLFYLFSHYIDKCEKMYSNTRVSHWGSMITSQEVFFCTEYVLKSSNW
jgi:hypothetical protein